MLVVIGFACCILGWLFDNKRRRAFEVCDDSEGVWLFASLGFWLVALALAVVVLFREVLP